MKILVLTKRQYMGKDLLKDRFGRFRELPLALARLGHDVVGLTLSYRPREEGSFMDFAEPAGSAVRWHSFNAIQAVVPRVGRFARRAVELATEFKPDIVWAGSDAYHVVFGAWLGKRVGARSVIDLYDNFEAFRASRLPPVLPLFRRAVRQVDGVTCFSKRLADHILIKYQRTHPTTVVENGVVKETFRPLDRQECRRRLNLPDHAQILGTAGALHQSRDVQSLFQAFRLLVDSGNEVHLALAGPRGPDVKIPTGPRVHDLGVLRHEEVPVFINALDLAVICYRQSKQGQYSFPQKAYEIMACRAPLIAAAVGTMIELLKNYPTCLYEPENPASLAAAARLQLRKKLIIARDIPSWLDSGRQLESFLEQVVDLR
ncbi:MAG TPA: glycosyltransferase [Candidatus Binatia bacterium]|nr:glycosyltransferase [Candidatus Binatia bacterium]